MHRLFWKIFLSFWLALILFSVAAVLAMSGYIEHVRAQDRDAGPFRQLAAYAAEGQAVADRDGLQGLRAWLSGLDRREAVPLLLLDAQGRDLLDRPVPLFISARFNGERRRPRRERGLSPPPITLGGESYRLVPDFQNVTLARVLGRPRMFAIPFFIAALVSALVCLLLSRYLTYPLERLRSATARFAAGDMTQRVAGALGGRRDEIADLARAFDDMAERLQRAFQAQRQLLRDASHELRSPLARLQAALGLARQRSERRVDAELDRIERETERLDNLIGQILALSRLEADVDQPAMEHVDLAELLQSLVEDAGFEAQVRGCRIAVTDTAAATVMANAALLHSALENVIRNAIKYTAAGTDVELSLRPDPARTGWVVVAVRDHGPGVPEADLPRLFKPFVRVGEARDRASGGYGLGLAIAERVLRLHGGEIVARNAVGGGLSVSIKLPMVGA